MGNGCPDYAFVIPHALGGRSTRHFHLTAGPSGVMRTRVGRVPTVAARAGRERQNHWNDAGFALNSASDGGGARQAASATQHPGGNRDWWPAGRRLGSEFGVLLAARGGTPVISITSPPRPLKSGQRTRETAGRFPLPTQAADASLSEQPRRCSSMAEHQLPKLNTRVRFPSSAPHNSSSEVCHSTKPRLPPETLYGWKSHSCCRPS